MPKKQVYPYPILWILHYERNLSISNKNYIIVVLFKYILWVSTNNNKKDIINNFLFVNILKKHFLNTNINFCIYNFFVKWTKFAKGKKRKCLEDDLDFANKLYKWHI